jgi:uncharacterized protein YbjT (DUF2867 family)
MQLYSAVVLGSTGNVGRQIVNLLTASSAVKQVVVMNRRQTDGFKGMPKVREVVVQYSESFAKGCKAGGVLSLGLMTAAGSDIKSSFTYVRIIGEKEKAVTDVGIPTLGIYKPSVIFGNSNTPPYLRYFFPAVQCVLPSRYHSIHKNELARAMVEGTQKALGELQHKRSEGGALPTPVVKSYEYSDMKPFFDKDDPKD